MMDTWLFWRDPHSVISHSAAFSAFEAILLHLDSPSSNTDRVEYWPHNVLIQLNPHFFFQRKVQISFLFFLFGYLYYYFYYSDIQREDKTPKAHSGSSRRLTPGRPFDEEGWEWKTH